MTSIVHLQKGEFVVARRTRQTLFLPIMLRRGHKISFALPVQIQRPSAIAQIVTNEIHITGIDQGRNIIIQQIRDISGKVLHPVGMKFHVDSKVAGLPGMRVFFIDMQCLFRGFEIEPVFNVTHIITERRDFTFLADIIRIQAGGLIRAGQTQVAHQKGGLTGKGIDRRITLIAFMNELLATRDDGFHGLIRFFANYFDAVSIVVGHFRIPRVLRFGVGETIANGNTRQDNVDPIIILFGKRQLFIALVNAMRNGGNIVA